MKRCHVPWWAKSKLVNGHKEGLANNFTFFFYFLFYFDNFFLHRHVVPFSLFLNGKSFGDYIQSNQIIIREKKINMNF